MIPGYVALSVVGRGAASTIHKVKCQKTGRSFALKQVKRENDPDGRFFEQVEAEYQVGRHISHPNVRQLLALHRVRKRLKVVELCLLMEYLEGRTLEQARISSIAELVGIFRLVAKGLRAMHRAGFVHADIKPNNIMLCKQNQVKLFDLGQSCSIGTVKQRIQGTPDFIAPEQVLKLPLGECTDVFNLGATMYWSLTGRAYPTRIKSKRTAQAFNLDTPGDVQAPQELNSAVPGVLSTLIMDCCRNNPHNRPRTMDQVLARMEAVGHVVRNRLSESTRSPEGQSEPPDPASG